MKFVKDFGSDLDLGVFAIVSHLAGLRLLWHHAVLCVTCLMLCTVMQRNLVTNTCKCISILSQL